MFNQIILKMPSANNGCDLYSIDKYTSEFFDRSDDVCFKFENLLHKDLYLKDINGEVILELTPEEALISAFDAGAFLADPFEVDSFFDNKTL
jgi:hypothetical protein